MSMPMIGVWAMAGASSILRALSGDAGEGLTEEGVLVRRGDDFELLRGGVVAEPAPAGALDCGGGCVELLLQACDVIGVSKGVRWFPLDESTDEVGRMNIRQKD